VLRADRDDLLARRSVELDVDPLVRPPVML
jgi:hypothetical protein